MAAEAEMPALVVRRPTHDFAAGDEQDAITFAEDELRPGSALSDIPPAFDTGAAALDALRPVSSHEQRGGRRPDGTVVDMAGMTNIKALKQLGDPQHQEDHGMNGLHVAAASGSDLTIAEFLSRAAEYGFQVDQPDRVGRTPLIFAVVSGSRASVDVFLKWGAGLNLADADGRTAIAWAAYHGRAKILAMLLEAGAATNIPDKEGRTVLHWAISHDSTKCLATLLKAIDGQHALINQGDANKMPALHYAAFQGRQKHIQALLKAGANPTVPDADGKTALHWTVASGDASSAKALMSVSRDVAHAGDREGRTVLHLAVIAGQPAVSLLAAALKHSNCPTGAQDTQGRSALHYCAAFGNQKAAELLVKSKANRALVDANHASALHYAAQHDKPAVVAELLSGKGPASREADVADPEGRRALSWAVIKGHVGVVRTLLDCRVDANAQDLQGHNALHVAAFSNQLECAQLLLERGIQSDAVDAQGQTPLFTACQYADEGLVNALLTHGADMQVTDAEGRGLLHSVSIAGRRSVVDLLLDRNTAINAFDSSGATPLHFASHYGHHDVAEVLLRCGAEPNVQDLDGISPIHWAALQGHTDCVGLLLSHQAYPNYMEHNGNRATPLDYAVAGGHMEVAQALVDGGGVYHENFAEYAAIKVQSLFRGFLIRRRFKGVIAEAREKRRRETGAATTIQAHARGFLERKRYQARRDDIAAYHRSVAEREAAERARSEEKEQQQREEAERDRKEKAKRQRAKEAKERRTAEKLERERSLASREAQRREAKLAKQREDERRLLKERLERQEEMKRQSGIWGQTDNAEQLAEVLMQKRVRQTLVAGEKQRIRSVRQAIAAATMIQRWYRRTKRPGRQRRHDPLPGAAVSTSQRKAGSTNARPRRDGGAGDAVRLPPIAASAASTTTASRRKRSSAERLSARQRSVLTKRQRLVAALTIQLWWRRLLAVRELRRYQRVEQRHGPGAAVQVQSKRVRAIYEHPAAKAMSYVPVNPRPARYTHGYMGPSGASQSWNSALASYFDLAGVSDPRRRQRKQAGRGRLRQTQSSGALGRTTSHGAARRQQASPTKQLGTRSSTLPQLAA